jgi:ketosteroid isomerase-like protein
MGTTSQLAYETATDAFARLATHDVHFVDDVSVEEGTFTGTHTGIARTGRAVALDYVLVLRSKDGKQVSMSLMLDRLLMLEQLGLTGDAGELL